MLFIPWAILFILTDWRVPDYTRKQPNPYKKLLFLILWLVGGVGRWRGPNHPENLISQTAWSDVPSETCPTLEILFLFFFFFHFFDGNYKLSRFLFLAGVQ